MTRLRAFINRFKRDEGGVAAVDFAVVMPLYFVVFLAAFETAMVMTRQVFLDRGVDMAVRVVRLNTSNPPDYDQLKTMICQATAMIENCDTALKLEMFSQDPRGTMTFKSRPDCVNRGLEVQPASIYQPGLQNQIMFVRACVKYEPFFPTAMIGTAIQDVYGEYALVAMSMYVAEPNG
ncbi:MAG: TadE/TadG family type IV pilus assembly protein [Pseudomonadota bacterium]